MTTNFEDDFWNQSVSSCSNNFFDDDDLPLENDSLTQEEKPADLPLEAIISNQSLKIVLDQQSTNKPFVLPSTPEEAVRRLFCGERCILNHFQTLKEKEQLLDVAIDLGDGNIIIQVTIFLSKHLKRNIFFKLLNKRKDALRHYSRYLIQNNDLTQLEELYMATNSNLKDLYFVLTSNSSNQGYLLQKLKQFQLNHSPNLSTADSGLQVQENILFLEYQLKWPTLQTKSVIGLLIHLCNIEIESNKKDITAVNDFKKLFNISDSQFDWVLMSTFCKAKQWDKLISQFVKTVWLSKKPSIRCAIDPETFVYGIGQHSPPRHIMEQFLSFISDTDKALFIAEKFKVHSFVVNYYVGQKNRAGLLQYKEKIDSTDEVMQQIISSLNSDIKWKN